MPKQKITYIDGVRYYPPTEEKLNIISHGLGFLLSLLASALLVIKAGRYGNAWHIVSVSIYGSSMLTLYAASTIYHSSKKTLLRKRLNVFDHASIYVLIAGTYTPFTLIVLGGTIGWVVFGISWGLALTGIILKLFYAGKYDLLSTIMYVLMGWMIVIAIKPLINNLSHAGLMWLLAGGIAYTIGAVWYSFKKLSFSHAIFHLFVLAGSICHFISVYYYLLPQAE